MNGLTPTFCILLLFLCLTIALIKKEAIIVPLIIAMCFLPADKTFLIGPLDFKAIRILALIAFTRLYIAGEIETSLNKLDKVLLYTILYGSVIYVIGSQNKFGAFVYKSGTFIDNVFLYFVFRSCIKSKESIDLTIKTLYWCVIALLPFTMFEFLWGKNLFSILGRSNISMRNGEIRAAATFSHAILFGSFGAAIFPVLWEDFINNKNIIKFIGLVSCVFIVFACSSSGPLAAFAAAVCFLIFFRWKKHSTLLSWSILFTAIFIHLVREKGLWHFIFLRLPLKSSSTGFHRYMLIEAATNEFKNWWLFGYGDLGPQWHLKYWPWTYAHFTDVTNQYLAEAVKGGVFTMIGFIILCYLSIKTLGAFSLSQKTEHDQRLWWGITVMMITHCISFLSVSYFGQINMLLYLTFALAAFAYDESQQIAKE